MAAERRFRAHDGGAVRAGSFAHIVQVRAPRVAARLFPAAGLGGAHVRASFARPSARAWPQGVVDSVGRDAPTRPRVTSRSTSLSTPASRPAELTGQSARGIFEIAVTGYPDVRRNRSVWRCWPGVMPRTRLKAALSA